MIDLPTQLLSDFCRREGIRRLALFGSHLHGDATPESDIDFLVEFEPDRTMGLLTLARLARELAELLGHPVDLRTHEDLSRYFREKVAAEAKTLYEAA